MRAVDDMTDAKCNSRALHAATPNSLTQRDISLETLAPLTTVARENPSATAPAGHDATSADLCLGRRSEATHSRVGTKLTSHQRMPDAGGVLRRYIFVKLKPPYAEELKLLQLQKTAQESLQAAYGVQAVHVGRAMDDATRSQWDLCITLELVSSVDLERCLKDTVTRAFIERYLAERAEHVSVGTFEGKLSGPRRA